MIRFLFEHWLEIFAVITGLLYVYLEIKQNKLMWIIGIISSLVFIFVFFDAKIYAQMGIYGYYVLISVYGYWKWHFGSAQCPEMRSLSEVETPAKSKIKNQKSKNLTLIIISLILSTILGYILTNFTNSTIPYFDGLVAGFSIVATWMLTQKIIQHWYFWMGINLFCVPLYASQGLYFTAFMFLVYFVMSIIGLREWRKMIEQLVKNQK
jgi:nicotinamide mononucleotide transporter